MPQQLNWMQADGERWYSFNDLDFSHPHFDRLQGVFIIWKDNGPVLKVGRGMIGDQLRRERDAFDLEGYGKKGVTWAEVPPDQQEGVERFLGEKLRPLLEGKYGESDPVEVNLPWYGPPPTKGWPEGA